MHLNAQKTSYSHTITFQKPPECIKKMPIRIVIYHYTTYCKKKTRHKSGLNTADSHSRIVALSILIGFIYNTVDVNGGYKVYNGSHQIRAQA
ncbi:hypothetical protein GDO78_000568 [Eleutherodactylus coqui]|uniref:Uncharacterized protein n=1 Tax=Eleutherodactylus coqui TaxID=57060 RepID=A0A8J6FR06_ELECQ|nr:hypothetical protein GDO78_000568 [Eleutherodactylus coqui]